MESLRNYLVGRGFLEAMTLSFNSPEDFQALGVEEEGQRALSLRNPLTVEQSRMRTTLLPGLLDVVAHNWKHDVEDLAIFEMGSVLLADENPPKELPREETCLGIAMVGRTWEGWGLSRGRSTFDLKGIVEALARIDADCSLAGRFTPCLPSGTPGPDHNRRPTRWRDGRNPSPNGQGMGHRRASVHL